MSSEHKPSLYVVRHGATGNDGSLNGVGRAQMASLRWALFVEIGARRVRILSSPQPRAIESAQLLCNGDHDFDPARDVVAWLDVSAYVRGKSSIPQELAAIRAQDPDPQELAIVLVMHKLDILTLMREVRHTGTPISVAVSAGSCWKLASSEEEPHRPITPIVSPLLRQVG